MEQSCSQKSITWRIFSSRYYHLRSPLSPLKEFAWYTEQNCLFFFFLSYWLPGNLQRSPELPCSGVGAGILCRENCLSEQVGPSKSREPSPWVWLRGHGSRNKAKSTTRQLLTWVWLNISASKSLCLTQSWTYRVQIKWLCLLCLPWLYRFHFRHFLACFGFLCYTKITLFENVNPTDLPQDQKSL